MVVKFTSINKMIVETEKMRRDAKQLFILVKKSSKSSRSCRRDGCDLSKKNLSW